MDDDGGCCCGWMGVIPVFCRSRTKILIFFNLSSQDWDYHVFTKSE